MLGRGARRHWPRRWLPGSSKESSRNPIRGLAGVRRGESSHLASGRRMVGAKSANPLISWFLPGRNPMLAGEARRIASDRAGFLGSHVWMPPVVQGAISRFRTRDRVRSCVRPPGAAFPCRGPVWRCADRVQITLGALRRALWLPLVFPIRIFDHLSMQFLRLPHTSHARPVGRSWSLPGQAIAGPR